MSSIGGGQWLCCWCGDYMLGVVLTPVIRAVYCPWIVFDLLSRPEDTIRCATHLPIFPHFRMYLCHQIHTPKNVVHGLGNLQICLPDLAFLPSQGSSDTTFLNNCRKGLGLWTAICLVKLWLPINLGLLCVALLSLQQILICANGMSWSRCDCHEFKICGTMFEFGYYLPDWRQ